MPSRRVFTYDARVDGNLGNIEVGPEIYGLPLRPYWPKRTGRAFIYSPVFLVEEQGEEDVSDFAAVFTKVNWPRVVARVAKKASLSIFEHYDVFGTAATDTDNYVYGTQGLKLTCPVGGNTTVHKAVSLDLTEFDDAFSTAALSTDPVQIWFRVDNAANFGALRVRFTSDAVGVYSNYFDTAVTTARNGWNYVAVPKSSFAQTGSPSWSNITAIQIRGTSNGNGTVRITVDDFRLIQASSSFTMEEVQDAEVELGSVNYKYEQVSQCIRQIADAMGAVWYIDPDRTVHFQKPATVAAPFELNDTSNNFIPDSLELGEDTSRLRNQVFVRGGEYQGNSTVYSQVADGSKKNFLTPYKLKNVSVTVNAVSKTVGIDNIDAAGSFDCLYNFEQKNLKFPSALSNGDVLAITGNPMLPVLVKKSDPVSIAEYGVYEAIVLDNSITTLQGGRDRATAELLAYREAAVEGRFSTLTPGLVAGQTIQITLSALGVDDAYIIKSVVMRARSPSAFQYDVTLISTRTQGVIDWLFDQLTYQRKNITADDNEVTDLVGGIDETVPISDQWTVDVPQEFTESQGNSEASDKHKDLGTVFVAGDYTPSSFSDTKRQFIVEGSLLG